MFHKLKNRLVLLYGITSSIILTVIIIGVFFINFKQSKEQAMVLFQKNVEQIIEKISFENTISSNWIDKMQTENHLLILIEDNGIQLTKLSHKSTAVENMKFIERLKVLAAEEGINLDRKPLYSSVVKTPIYNLSMNSSESYLGMAGLIPRGDAGFRNVMVIYQNNSGINYFFEQIILYIIIDFIGIVALFLISSLYIGKVLKPLEEGQKKQNAFVAAVSHELRSPLTVIKAGITSIREDISKVDQFLPHLEGECGRMTRLISDMLMLASVDAKTWSLQKDQVDMDTLLIESYDMFCTCFNNKNHEFTLDLQEEELYAIHGDKERIMQILTILMDNAISHTPNGGMIALRAYNQKHFVVVEVEDQGMGISDEDKKLVFERFYRGDKSRNDKKHFGLGLSIAKELVELHNGHITIKDALGGGAIFVLQLPC
jgi:OmpR-family two-component system manganese-sensing sensor histidine kinase